VFCVLFLLCIFSALFALIYFTVVFLYTLCSVRSGCARSTRLIDHPTSSFVISPTSPFSTVLKRTPEQLAAIDGKLGDAQLPNLRSLAVNPSNYVWYDAPTGWASQLSTPSPQVLSTNTPRLKNLSPSEYQHLKHLVVSLRIMGAGLQQEIKGLDKWLDSPGS